MRERCLNDKARSFSYEDSLDAHSFKGDVSSWLDDDSDVLIKERPFILDSRENDSRPI